MRWPWQSPPRKDPPRSRIHGVWGTAHTANGDFDTAPASDVEINGERTTYDLRTEYCPLSGAVETITLHVGALVVEVRLTPPERVRRGDSLTVRMPVEMSALVARDPIRRDYR